MAASPKPREQHITLGTLKARGWTPGLIRSFLAEPDKLSPNPHYRSGPNKMKLYRLARVEEMEAQGEISEYLEKTRQRRERIHEKLAVKKKQNRAAKDERVKSLTWMSEGKRRRISHYPGELRGLAEEALVEELKERVKAALPTRWVIPESIELHLGPTNSGKTHDAVAYLAQAGSGVFASPLRALAWEVFDRLRSQVGEEKVGLLTGEEAINEGAAIMCCTAEMAPGEGDTLVLDEAHWAADPERGYAWVKLLMGGNYRHLRICAPEQTASLLRAFLEKSGGEIQEFLHQRLTPLTFGGGATFKELPVKTVLVAFSRKAVLGLAREWQKAIGKEVGALYGAMPPVARRREIQRFMAGEIDYLVATDLIGHGVNLPCDAVCFAETTKFDGEQRRSLYAWEAAQIAGRAGRFGLSQAGRVFVLRNTMPGMALDQNLIEMAVQVADGSKFDPKLDNLKGKLGVTLGGLGQPANPDELRAALRAWRQVVPASIVKLPLATISIERLQDRLKTILEPAWEMEMATLWTLLKAPFDDLELLEQAASHITRGSGLEMPPASGSQSFQQLNIEKLERWASRVRDVACLVRSLPEQFKIPSAMLAEIEEAIAKRIVEVLPSEIKENKFGRCASCRKPCPPWFDECDRCHRSGWDNDDDWGGGDWD